jgi:hypothetical protein
MTTEPGWARSLDRWLSGAFTALVLTSMVVQGGTVFGMDAGMAALMVAVAIAGVQLVLGVRDKPWWLPLGYILCVVISLWVTLTHAHATVFGVHLALVALFLILPLFVVQLWLDKRRPPNA